MPHDDDHEEVVPSTIGPPLLRSRVSRRDKIVAEIQRNRQGGHRIPTWVLAALLAAILIGFAALLIFG